MVIERYRVEATEDGIATTGHGRRLTPRGQIRSLSVRWGFLAGQPLGTLAVGLGFLAAAAYSLLRPSCLTVLVVPLVLLGGVFVYSALSRGYYLDIETHRGRLKMRLFDCSSMVEAESFLRELHERFGYPISAPSPVPPQSLG